MQSNARTPVTSARRRETSSRYRSRTSHGYLHNCVILVICLSVIFVTFYARGANAASVRRHDSDVHTGDDRRHDVSRRPEAEEETSFESELRAAIEEQRRQRRKHRKLAMKVGDPSHKHFPQLLINIVQF